MKIRKIRYNLYVIFFYYLLLNAFFIASIFSDKVVYAIISLILGLIVFSLEIITYISYTAGSYFSIYNAMDFLVLFFVCISSVLNISNWDSWVLDFINLISLFLMNCRTLLEFRVIG